MSNKFPPTICFNDIRINDYIACRYDEQWWIGLIEEVNKEEEDVKISFLHPPGPAASFIWPARKDACFIPITDLIMKVDTPHTLTGRTYVIKVEEMTKINEAFLKS